MADQLPPPPAPMSPRPGDGIPPSPEDAPRPHTTRLWGAAIIAVAAVGSLIALLVLSLGEGGPGGGGGSVLFRDDFSGPGSSRRWLEEEDETGSMRYEGGVYRIAVTRRGELQSLAALASKQPSLRVEVDATMVEGDGGFSVLCISELSGQPGQITELADRGEYYDFFLSFADDGYAILSSEDLGTPLTVAGDPEGILRDGGPTHVEVDCVGSAGSDPAQLALSVNGQEVLRYADPNGAASFAAVGLTVYSPEGPATAEFDDITVSAT